LTEINDVHVALKRFFVELLCRLEPNLWNTLRTQTRRQPVDC